MDFITVSSIQRYATAFKDGHDIETIKLIADGKGKDSEI